MQVDDGAGKRIRELRIALGKAQAELVASGLSASYLSMIESGARRPTVQVLHLLADALATTVEYLATGHQPAHQITAHEQLLFGEMALHTGDPTDALASFAAVLAGPATTLHHRARVGRARALEGLGRLDDAATQLDELWREANPGSQEWAQLGIDILRVHRQAGDLDYAASVGEQALAVFDEMNLAWSDEAVRLGVSLAAVYLYRRDLLRAATLLRRLMSVAETMDSPLARGSAYWNASMVAQARGRHADARILIERALALFGETDRARNLAQLHGQYGFLLLEQGEVAAGRTQLLEAHRRLEDLGSNIDLAECQKGLASAALVSGDVAEAHRHAEAALRRLPAGTAPAARGSVLVLLASAYHLDGDTAKAHATLAAVEEELHGQTGRVAAKVWHEAATIWESAGEPEQAMRAYRAALWCAGHPTPRLLPSRLTAPRPLADRNNGDHVG
jgi:tetratricopeptide (TPR) repeat protein